jgi:hypothetical protein
MNRPGFVIAAVVVTSLSWSCRGPSPDELPGMLGVEGCLTASGDDLVLTRLTSSAEGSQTNPPDTGTATGLPAPQATQMFTLTGMEDELRPHVGQQVRVRGEAHAPEVAVLRQHEGSAATGTPGTATPSGAASEAGGQAQVTTMQKTRFESTELMVRAVTSLNRPCVAP